MLGTDFVANATDGANILPTPAERLDVTNRIAIARALDQARPAWVVNAAGFTRVDDAEDDVARAEAVNGTAVRALGEECAQRGIRVLHFSTDYVFPGTGSVPYRESDPADPVNAYGRSKLLGERGLVDSGARTLIIRTQWLFGLAGRSFPRTMWERAVRGQATRVVNDQTGRPTYTVDVALAAWRLIGQDARGIVHAANSGTATWFEVARHVFERAGVPHLVSPCRSDDFPTRARRPAYSVLDTSKLESALGTPLPPWHDALDRFIAELRAREPAP
jgi:dTDP-4-dehydrorhamnose reductase